MNMNEQDASDLELGRLVRDIVEGRSMRLDIHNELDRGFMVIAGDGRDGKTGDKLNSVVSDAAQKAGVIPRMAPAAARSKAPTMEALRGG
jgi:hypothetical protein